MGEKWLSVRGEVIALALAIGQYHKVRGNVVDGMGLYPLQSIGRCERRETNSFPYLFFFAYIFPLFRIKSSLTFADLLHVGVLILLMKY